MDILNFKLTPSLPATPYVSDTLKGGKTFLIDFPEGKRSAIFIQQSTDGTSWKSKQSVSVTNSATVNVSADNDTYLRVLVSERPKSASYKDYSHGGGGGSIEEEFDPTVPAWAKQPTKPTYTPEEIGAAPQSELDTLSLKVEEIDVKEAVVLPDDGKLAAGTSYKLGEIASLSLNSIPTSDYETTIYFTAGEGFTMSIPDCEVVGELSAEEGKSYVISILNGVVIMGEVSSFINE